MFSIEPTVSVAFITYIFLFFYSCFVHLCYFEDYEVKRHIDILESGGAVEQETRSFDKRKK